MENSYVAHLLFFEPLLEIFWSVDLIIIVSAGVFVDLVFFQLQANILWSVDLIIMVSAGVFVDLVFFRCRQRFSGLLT
jgi:ABC-type Co2+ transport system permease subunit